MALNDLAALGHPDVANQLIEGVLDGYPDDHDLKWEILSYYYGSNRFLEGRPFAERFLSVFCNSSHIYRFLAHAYKFSGARENVVKILEEGQRVISRPIDFQAAADHAIPDRVQDTVVEELRRELEPDSPTLYADALASAPSSPLVETLSAQEIGTQGAVLCGRIGQTSSTGEYAFQYGDSRGELTQETPWQKSPPGLFPRCVIPP